MLKRNFIQFVLVAMLAFIFSIPTVSDAAVSDNWTLDIFHTGDVHGHGMVYDEAIGYGKTVAYVKSVRAQKKFVLFFDVGDTFSGTPAAEMSKGADVLKVLNMMDYDAFTPGNADFLWGGQHTVNMLKKAKFPVISANFYYKGKRVYKPYIIKTINGVKFGITGVSPVSAQVASIESQMIDYEFRNPIDELKKVIPDLRQKVDVVIVLAHIGKMETNKNDEYVSVQKIVAAVDGIDIIIDGHDHVRLEAGQKIGNTFIVNTGEYNKWISDLTLEISGKKIIGESAKLLDKKFFANIEPDPAVEEFVKKNYDAIETLLNKEVAVAPFYFEGRREFVRTSQTSLGWVFADAEREMTGADIAFTVGAFLRESLEKGPFTRSRILTVLPMFHYTVIRNMTGQQIVDFIEHNYYDNMRNGKTFLPSYTHVSGLTYTVDFNRPEGHRMIDIKVNGVALDPNKVYTVACNEQISDYGIRDIPIVRRYNITMADLFVDYLNKHPDLKMPEPRVRIINR
ncbi:MAG: bifunctional metallophosphatase/5'-nucleotidase [Elusimicrobiota bacterium]|jgi:2',3'-cyclic-nucleotide 2'-phosphodiesterase (5'-nucleotidase family)|nr:bifunctional metallophosphatase/5'-nucleotidase [Elusimicrobiota bacterium]